MRLAFFGSTRFGRRCLEVAAAVPGVQLVGILTAPKRFSISYRPEGVTNVLHEDFGANARSLGAPLSVFGEEPGQKMSDEVVVQTVQSWDPELIVVAGWYHMVPKRIRDIAPAIGLHASLLPDYSGGAPLVWAMINGAERTGISLFKLGAGVDDGPILGQVEEPIHLSDTIATLYARIEEDGLRLLQVNIPKLMRGDATWTVQDESQRRIMPQRSPADGLVNWSWPARRVYDFVRAQTRPYPGAFTFWQGKRVTLWAASMLAADDTWIVGRSAEPGVAALSAAGELVVTCGNGSGLVIQELEYDGRSVTGSALHLSAGGERPLMFFTEEGVDAEPELRR